MQGARSNYGGAAVNSIRACTDRAAYLGLNALKNNERTDCCTAFPSTLILRSVLLCEIAHRASIGAMGNLICSCRGIKR